MEQKQYCYLSSKYSIFKYTSKNELPPLSSYSYLIAYNCLNQCWSQLNIVNISKNELQEFQNQIFKWDYKFKKFSIVFKQKFLFFGVENYINKKGLKNKQYLFNVITYANIFYIVLFILNLKGWIFTNQKD
ncbi:unnamed protein product [Paramecium octaurelia]|uniref:Transmembrane protein n=1 Tax=Paramecium octaurelia TaxID=43137 RepID=A0A8S1WUM1_PAROT|nr:unnamed protein product [Paramecium octaurelia]